MAGTRILSSYDPIFGLSFQMLFASVGVLELVTVAALIVGAISSNKKLIIVCWISCCFLLYRADLWLVHWQHPCPCLGAFGQALHIPDKFADGAMFILALYMLVGSALLLLVWKRH